MECSYILYGGEGGGEDKLQEAIISYKVDRFGVFI